MKYFSELRYYDDNCDDYVSQTFEAKTKDKAFLKAVHYHVEGKGASDESQYKVNVFERRDEVEYFCIQSTVITNCR